MPLFGGASAGSLQQCRPRRPNTSEHESLVGHQEEPDPLVVARSQCDSQPQRVVRPLIAIGRIVRAFIIDSSRVRYCKKRSDCQPASLRRLDGGDRVGAIDLVGLESHFVADLQPLEHGRVLNLEDHRHVRHLQIRDGAVAQRDLLRLLVDTAHLALDKLRARTARCGGRRMVGSVIGALCLSVYAPGDQRGDEDGCKMRRLHGQLSIVECQDWRDHTRVPPLRSTNRTS